MHAERTPKNSRHGARIGVLTAILALATAVGPASAGAVITPHAVTPKTVTPHAATPSSSPSNPAPSPAPAPSYSAPSLPDSSAGPTLPSAGRSGTGSDTVPESEIAGAGVPGSASDSPYPEGLPNHWEEGCDLSCKQEWLSYYEDRYTAVWVEAQAGGTPDEKKAAELLKGEVGAIEDEIKEAGGTPGEDQGGPSGESIDGDSGSQAEGASLSQVAADLNPLEVDAISGAGPIVTNVLGTWDGTWIATVLGAPFIDAFASAWNADVGPCPKGSEQRADAQVTDPNGGSNRCF